MMILSIFPKCLVGNLLLGFLFVLDQTKSQANTQELSTIKLRHDTRFPDAKSSNTSLSTAGLKPKRQGTRPIPANASRNIQPANTMRRHDQTPDNYTRSLRTSPSVMQDASDQYDTRIPFWNIAHMINSINEIDQALK